MRPGTAAVLTVHNGRRGDALSALCGQLNRVNLGNGTAVVSQTSLTEVRSRPVSSPPICCLIGIDVSGSMGETCSDGGTRLQHAKDGLRELLQGIKNRRNKDDVVFIVAFDHKQHVVTAWTQAHKLDVSRAVDNIRGGGGTAIYDVSFNTVCM